MSVGGSGGVSVGGSGGVSVGGSGGVSLDGSGGVSVNGSGGVSVNGFCFLYIYPHNVRLVLLVKCFFCLPTIHTYVYRYTHTQCTYIHTYSAVPVLSVFEVHQLYSPIACLYYPHV